MNSFGGELQILREIDFPESMQARDACSLPRSLLRQTPASLDLFDISVAAEPAKAAQQSLRRDSTTQLDLAIAPERKRVAVILAEMMHRLQDVLGQRTPT